MTAPRRPGLLVALFVVALAAYLPYVWLVLDEPPWSEYRESWIRMWPILPGLFPRAWFARGSSELVGTCVMAGSTVLLLGPCVFLGERSYRALWGAVAVVAVLSCLNSWCAYHVFAA